MGCDYYIVKQLEINHINCNDENTTTMIELNKEKKYFLYEMEDSFDSDDSFDCQEYNDKYEKKYAKYINVTYVPRILFENGKWKNTSIQEKYETSVKEQIGNDKILSIIKKEIRYLR
jgi:hypothetical protein